MPLGWIAGAALVDAGVQAYNAYNASQIAGSQEGMAQTIFGEQQGYEQQLQKLLANPSSVTSLPGYAFQMQQGSQAVARQMAAGGFLGSGNEGIALEQYGQGLASNFYTTQANLLASLSGITSASSPSQAGSVAASAQSSAANQTNNLLGELGMFYGLYGGNLGTSTGIPSAGYGGQTYSIGGYQLTSQ